MTEAGIRVRGRLIVKAFGHESSLLQVGYSSQTLSRAYSLLRREGDMDVPTGQTKYGEVSWRREMCCEFGDPVRVITHPEWLPSDISDLI